MKDHRTEALVTTLLCLLPALAGALIFQRLPETIATNFAFDGTANGWSSRGFAVFGIPAFMAGINLLLQFALRTDPKQQNMNPTLRTIAVWTVPAISVLVCALILGRALDYAVPVERVVPLLTGILFILIGNYLPKTKQSYTMGIKLPWTLASEENWNRTHRFAGFLWVLGGFAMVLLTLLRLWRVWLLLMLIAVLTLLPSAYSYLLYRKGI